MQVFDHCVSLVTEFAYFAFQYYERATIDGETQFGECWPTLGNATRESQKLPLAKCCCNFTMLLALLCN